jgi:small subunit ribosomal protein S7
MSRRRVSARREILPDPKYGDRLVSKFVNSLMFEGRKSTAEGILYGALDLLEERTKGQDPVEIFKNAVENIRPAVEVKSRRVGGSTYQVPVEVRPDRRTALAIRWLINASRARGERTMRERLANELLDAANNRGAAAKKKDETHRMAEANRAFAHYRW